MNHIEQNRGFTLIELLVAMTLSAIALASVYSAYTSQQQAHIVQEDVVEMQQNMRVAVYFMVKELRMAGYDPHGDSGAAITTADPTTCTFTLVADDDDVNNDGDADTDEPGELSTIEYSLFDDGGDGDTDLGRRVDGAAVLGAIAENIENIEFYYTLADGTQTLDPNPTQHDSIRTVQVTILARTGRSRRNYTNSNTYTTPSGAEWKDFNDGFRRRMLTSTVSCRNLGF